MRHAVSPLASRRTVVVLGGTLLAVALVVACLVAASGPADAATRTVKKTFSNQAPVVIPAGSVLTGTSCSGPTSGTAAPYPSQRTASFPRGSRIKDVNLALKNYSHTFPDDVDVLLAHKGVNRTVMSDAGSSLDVNNITLKLDDEAPSALPDSSQIVAGSFRPANFEPGDNFPPTAPTQDNRSALAGFDGNNPSGTWNLFVQDDAGGDCGTFQGGWSITITAAVPS